MQAVTDYTAAPVISTVPFQAPSAKRKLESDDVPRAPKKLKQIKSDIAQMTLDDVCADLKRYGVPEKILPTNVEQARKLLVDITSAVEPLITKYIKAVDRQRKKKEVAFEKSVDALKKQVVVEFRKQYKKIALDKSIHDIMSGLTDDYKELKYRAAGLKFDCKTIADVDSEVFAAMANGPNGPDAGCEVSRDADGEMSVFWGPRDMRESFVNICCSSHRQKHGTRTGFFRVLDVSMVLEAKTGNLVITVALDNWDDHVSLVDAEKSMRRSFGIEEE